jgi:HTH-type transcriptional regulator / antitoxin HigA
MNIQARSKAPSFHGLLKDYQSLCSEYLPRPIHDERDHTAAQKAIFPFLGFESKLTPDQADYVEAISIFIEQFEQQNVKWPQSNPIKLLKLLLQEHNMSGADLARLLKVNESMGGKILRRERNLTVEHIRLLSKKFSVSPALFVS